MKYFLITIISIVIAMTVFIPLTNEKKKDMQGTGGSYDYSNPHAIKTILSKDLNYFEYSFVTEMLNSYYGRNIPYRRIEFILDKEESGANLKGYGYKEGGESFEFEFTAPLSVIDDLQAIVEKHRMANVNGLDEGIMGINDEYFAHRLVVRYDSGEKITAYKNNGGFFSGENNIDIYDFFMNLANEHDPNFTLEDEEYWEPHKVLVGRYESEDLMYAIEFKQSMIKIYKNDKLVEEVSFRVYNNEINKSGVSSEFIDFEYFYWEDGQLLGELKDAVIIVFYPVNK